MQKQFTKKQTLAVKGLAILLLLTYHLFETEHLVTSMNVNYAPFELPDFLMFTGFGNICVAVFVFLTAYGIAKGLLEAGEITAQQAYGQATKRFLRLMLNFVILYASVNALWWYKFDYRSLYGEKKQGFLYMLTDATGLSMFFDTPTLNMTWWYMEIAYLLIFLVPFLVWLVKKIGYPILLLALFVPAMIVVQPDLERYLFTAVVGVCAAYGKWPEWLMSRKWNPVLQWVAAFAGFAVCVLVRQNFAVQESYVHIVDAFVALFLVWFAGVLLDSVPVLSTILEFIGKHAMNIYLVHTFFYMALWQKYIYQFKYAGLILLVLLAVCLIYSIVLEGLKKGVQFLIKKCRK